MKYLAGILSIVCCPLIASFALERCPLGYCKDDTAIILHLEYNRAVLGEVRASNALRKNIVLKYFDPKGAPRFHNVHGAESLAHNLLATKGCLVRGAPNVCVGDQVFLMNEEVTGIVIGISREIDQIAVRVEAIKESDTLQLRVGSSRNIEVLSKSPSELEMPRWLGSVPAFPF